MILSYVEDMRFYENQRQKQPNKNLRDQLFWAAWSWFQFSGGRWEAKALGWVTESYPWCSSWFGPGDQVTVTASVCSPSCPACPVPHLTRVSKGTLVFRENSGELSHWPAAVWTRRPMRRNCYRLCLQVVTVPPTCSLACPVSHVKQNLQRQAFTD